MRRVFRGVSEKVWKCNLPHLRISIVQKFKKLVSVGLSECFIVWIGKSDVSDLSELTLHVRVIDLRTRVDRLGELLRQWLKWVTKISKARSAQPHRVWTLTFTWLDLTEARLTTNHWAQVLLCRRHCRRHMKSGGYNIMRDDIALLEEHEKSPPSFSVHLYPGHWTLNNGPKFLYNNQISVRVSITWIVKYKH